MIPVTQPLPFLGIPLVEFLGITKMEAQLAKRGPRGGARSGSGPKPKPDTRMVTRAFVIRQDQAKWLTDVADAVKINKSEALRRILDEARNCLYGQLPPRSTLHTPNESISISR